MEIKLGITLIFLSWTFANIIYKLLTRHEKYLMATGHVSHNDYPMASVIIIAIFFFISVVGVISLFIGIWKL